MPKFSVLIEVHVEADDKRDAEEEVLGLMSYAFEVSNDQGIFKQYGLSDSVCGETVEIKS
jgi:hypothetical protein